MEKRLKVAFLTLGCKVNQYETNAMIQKFTKKGYKEVNFNEFADIYIINTCTVTNMADRKSRQMLRRVKTINPNSVLVACGCYAQANKQELEKVKEIDIIIGTNKKNEVVDLVEEFILKKQNIEAITDVFKEKDYSEFGSITYTEKTRAVIKVQDGCDRFCSYCIIPYARGRVRSRKLENILDEVKQIAKNGIKEVVITGIHVASYGKDFKIQTGLIDLLEELNKIEEIKRIRLSSLEPIIFTDDFIKRLIKLDKVCHHFHLSLQSACNKTLERMNRRYSIEEFIEITNKLKKAYNDVCLTTDIIVGFPGETEEEFNTTYKNLEKIKFYKMHVFKYSKRKGTKAEVMPNQVPDNIKEQRSKKLLELSQKNEYDINKSYLNQTVKVLFEEEKDGLYQGHTNNYMLVKVKSKDDIKNKIIDVIITNVTKDEIVGEIKK